MFSFQDTSLSLGKLIENLKGRSSISLPKKGICTAEADRLPIGRQVDVPSKLNNENRFAILDCSFAAIRDRFAIHERFGTMADLRNLRLFV